MDYNTSISSGSFPFCKQAGPKGAAVLLFCGLKGLGGGILGGIRFLYRIYFIHHNILSQLVIFNSFLAYSMVNPALA